MNPYNYIIDNYYGGTLGRFGFAAAAVLLLKVLAANYEDDMPSDTNPYKWALDKLITYDVAPTNDFLRYLKKQWHGKANPHI